MSASPTARPRRASRYATDCASLSTALDEVLIYSLSWELRGLALNTSDGVPVDALPPIPQVSCAAAIDYYAGRWGATRGDRAGGDSETVTRSRSVRRGGVAVLGGPGERRGLARAAGGRGPRARAAAGGGGRRAGRAGGAGAGPAGAQPVLERRGARAAAGGAPGRPAPLRAARHRPARRHR